MSSITVSTRTVGNVNEGSAALPSDYLQVAASLDNVWEVISQAYPTAIRSYSSFTFELVTTMT